MPLKELAPFAPIDADGNRLRAAGTKKRFEQRSRFARRDFHRALPRQKFGDALVARDITFAAEHAPVHGQRRQTERLTMMREASRNALAAL